MDMLKNLAERFYRFSLSGLCTLLLFLFSYACVVLECPELGICVLAAYSCFVCLSSGDVIPLILPLLLLYCMTFFCPSSVFLVFLAIPCGVALCVRLFLNRRQMRPGKLFYGLLATTGALVLGGIGSISAGDYFAPGPIYLILALGPLMLGVYFLLRSSLALPRTYDMGDYICSVMYVVAVFVAFLILRIFLTNPEILIDQNHVVHKLEMLVTWRNGASNLAIILLPFIFYYARRHSAWHVLSAIVVYAIVALAGARAAMVIGAAVLFLGLMYFSHRRPVLQFTILGVIVACGAVAFFLRGPILSFVENFLCISLDDINVKEESRYLLAVRGVEDFFHAPVFGRGLGYTGNADIYPLETDIDPNAARFRVHWYHSLIPQIIGSMGVAGILAYGYQFLLRLRAILRARRTMYTAALVIAYISMLLYSQFDPGIFSPMPFGLLTVLLLTLLEAEEKQQIT